MILPEKLVVVFTPNLQSLSGVLDLVGRAAEYRRTSSDPRPLAVFPLPSRIEDSEHEMKKLWRSNYQSGFEEIFRRIYKDDECSLTAYFDEVQIPYRGFFAYGEKIAVQEERSEAFSLRRSYETFYHRLIDLDFAWDTTSQSEKGSDIATQLASVPPLPVATDHSYDVFLSYNVEDRDAAVVLNRLLSKYGVKVFLDVEVILPGQYSKQILLRGLSSSRSLAVLIGQKGASASFFTFELKNFGRFDTASQRPIIPILLPGTSSIDLPLMLQNLSSVEFSSFPEDENAILSLISGILGRRLDRLPASGSARRPVSDPVRSVPPPRPLHYRTLLNGLARGRVVLALGPGATLSGRPPAVSWSPGSPELVPSPAELAAHLAEHIDCPPGWSDDLTRVAQVVALSSGEASLNDLLRDVYKRVTSPTPVHRFLAALPGVLKERGWPPHQLYITTAYDDLLEQALGESGERYDLLSIDANSDGADTLFLQDEERIWKPLRVDQERSSARQDTERVWRTPSMSGYDIDQRLKDRSILLRIQGSVKPEVPSRGASCDRGRLPRVHDPAPPGRFGSVPDHPEGLI